MNALTVKMKADLLAWPAVEVPTPADKDYSPFTDWFEANNVSKEDWFVGRGMDDPANDRFYMRDPTIQLLFKLAWGGV